MSKKRPKRKSKQRDDRPTQVTPKGLRIPVPTRGEWERVLDRATRPVDERDKNGTQ